MGLFSSKTKTKDIFEPPHDPVFSYLYSRLVIGAVPLYQAQLPFESIQPFSRDYKPHKTKEGLAFLNSAIREVRAGNLTVRLWVYPEDDKFIMSDEYMMYYVLHALGAKTVGCEVMGPFAANKQHDVRGPAPVEFVRQLPGGPDFDPSKRQVVSVNEAGGVERITAVEAGIERRGR